MPTALSSIAYAMRYSDDVGLVWASFARIHGRAAIELAGIAKALVCFPVLTDRPAFQTPWATRSTCNWYDTRTNESRERIRTLVAENHIKVVVYWGCPGNSVDLRFLRGLGLRTINCEIDSYPTNGKQTSLKRLTKSIMRKWLRIAIHDRYIANAHHQGRFLLDFACLPPDRVNTVVDGVDLQHFTPEPRPKPGDLNLPSTDYYVVSVSQARPEKRVDVIIDAAIELFRQRPGLSVTFVHVGGGQCLSEWKARASQLGERFQFPGTKSDAAPYLRLATIFTHAAERESFGYAVTEAMACGKPVVATRSPGPSEIIDPGVTGIVVESGDFRAVAREISELLDDPGRCQRMGTAGRERVSRLYNNQLQAVELAKVLRAELQVAG